MIEYKIAAIPTVYRGRQYRSRLEARWAAFFDALGIRHEYEPFDLGLWSPDFLLPDLNVLVEVKPLTRFDETTWIKMVDAVTERDCNSGILLTRTAPIPSSTEAIEIGWIGFSWTDEWVSHRAFMGWMPRSDRPEFTPDIIHPVGLSDWVSASGDMGSFNDGISPHPYGRHVAKLWAAATNSVQWNPE